METLTALFERAAANRQYLCPRRRLACVWGW